MPDALDMAVERDQERKLRDISRIRADRPVLRHSFSDRNRL